jgi:ATP-dependent DNA ligase I
VLLIQIAEVSRVVAATSARLAKIEALAGALRETGPLEVPIAVAYLSGELPQRQIGVGWAALRDGFPPAAVPTLTLSDVDTGFSAIGAVSGKGSAAARKALVGELFGRATADEQRFLAGLLSGELRQGALEGVMAEAVARAAAVPVAEVRRAVMLRGSLGAVAAAALSGGSAALAEFGLEVGRPLRPMLASSAATIDEALAKAGRPAAVEWKLDGIRIQAHLSGGDVRLFTRTLDDITARLPDVVAALAKLPLSAAVLDGELIALREDGTPLPFQDTAARTASQDLGGPAVPLSVFLFDALHLEGADLIDHQDRERHLALARVVPPDLLMPRLVTASAEEATAFFTDALAHGHEGIVVKSLSTPYTAGRRGAGWIKVKPRHTLDLVVLAVEWGHGRRRGWLSNLHLGARDPATGGFVMLGKTFKGLTDELLAWQTQRLLALEDHRDSYTVYVRPELVVEIAFDGVQRSPRYPGGLALRFARVLRYREDKTAAEADTIDTIRALSPLLPAATSSCACCCRRGTRPGCCPAAGPGSSARTASWTAVRPGPGRTGPRAGRRARPGHRARPGRAPDPAACRRRGRARPRAAGCRCGAPSSCCPSCGPTWTLWPPAGPPRPSPAWPACRGCRR